MVPAMMSGMMISEDKDARHVVAVPPNWDDPERTKAVALLIKKDVPGTRLLLHGKVPRILASYSSTESAGAIASDLRGLGLQVRVCKDSSLRSPPGFISHSVKLTEGDILFADRGGAFLRLRSADVSVLVTGGVDIREDREVVKTSTKLNLPATLLTGGIPVRRTVSRKTVESVTNTVRFAFIYGVESKPIVELRQDGFDYSCLGSEMSLSSSLNFGRVIARLRRSLPAVAFDEALNRAFKTDVRTSGPWESALVASNLVFLFHGLHI
jgi:hypothetical protein